MFFIIVVVNAAYAMDSSGAHQASFLIPTTPIPQPISRNALTALVERVVAGDDESLRALKQMMQTGTCVFDIQHVAINIEALESFAQRIETISDVEAYLLVTNPWFQKRVSSEVFAKVHDEISRRAAKNSIGDALIFINYVVMK